MKAIITVILLLQFIQAKTQINIVRLNCPDSIGFITNQGTTRACEFLFENGNPDLFYVEDFSHKDFYNLLYKEDRSKISRVKLVSPKYIPAIHDFVFAYNKQNTLLFYYILKDDNEEKLLLP